MAYWLWYPGDFEIYHGMLQNMQREERGYGWPAYWKMDDWRKHVLFRYHADPEKETAFTVHAVGIGHVRLDGKKHPFEKTISCPAGKHEIEIDVGNMTGLPAVYVEGELICSTPAWLADDFEEEKAAGWSPLYQDAGCKPFQIPYQLVHCVPAGKKGIRNGVMFDFGRMINGQLTLLLKHSGQTVTAAYGESEAEALDLAWCYYKEEHARSGVPLRKRAFRYVFVPDTQPEDVDCSAIHEVFPLECKASFQSDDPLVNRIWQIAKETYHLCSGLFFIDGIKRDRWIWSGDAYQSYFVNQYLFFDEEINKRTIRALRGHTPIVQHLNTIVDYSMLWLISLENHYWMTGDRDFLAEMYPKMQAMMALLNSQLNPEGFIYGRKQDWIYIDWAEMDKDGVLCAEQILLWRCYRTMAYVADVLGQADEGYARKANQLKEKIQAYFWKDDKKAFIDTYESGKENVTRHANIFAVLFDLAEGQQARDILSHVLLNDAIPAITTPYFKFFELDMWGKVGRLDIVWNTIRSYWGGMIEKGATTFWEQYDPSVEGAAQYAMYGDPFGKSLCHAWAASPIYLLGRYFLGLKPTEPGYRSFSVEPKLDFFTSLSCEVPVKDGIVRIEKKSGDLFVSSSRSGGMLKYQNQLIEIPLMI